MRTTVVPVCVAVLSPTSVGHCRRWSISPHDSVTSRLSTLTPYPDVDAFLPLHQRGGVRERTLLLTVRNVNIAGKHRPRCNSNFIFGCYVTGGDWTNRLYPSNSKWQKRQEVESLSSRARSSERTRYFSHPSSLHLPRLRTHPSYFVALWHPTLSRGVQ